MINFDPKPTTMTGGTDRGVALGGPLGSRRCA